MLFSAKPKRTIDRGSDGTAHKEFRLDFVHHILIRFDHAVFSNSSVWKVINFRAFSSHATECVTSFADIIFGAGGIHVGADWGGRQIRQPWLGKNQTF